MKQFFKIIIPIILVIAIIACIGWYLFIYDRNFTRDMLLNGARYFDEQGNHTLSAWLYDQAYLQVRTTTLSPLNWQSSTKQMATLLKQNTP